MARVFFARDLSVNNVWVSNDLWVTDGTVGGTHRVGLANAQELAHVDGALFVGVGSNTPTQLSVVDHRRWLRRLWWHVHGPPSRPEWRIVFPQQ
jgi:hypothetical protein